MPLINCKVDLKLKWKKYCVLAVTAIDSNNGNPNRIIFTINDTNIYVPVVTLLANDNQKLSKLLRKGFERSLYWNEYKTKNENKNVAKEYRYFFESNFVRVDRLFVLVCTNQDNSIKRFNAKKYYLPKGTVKNYNVIINGRNLYDQPIDSDIKQYKE